MRSLRVSKPKIRHLLIKLKLLDMGDILTAEKIGNYVENTADLLNDDEIFNKSFHTRIANEFDFYERTYEAYKQQGIRSRVPSMHVKSLQRTEIETFLKYAIAMKKCEHCGCHARKLRKDGSSKIFLKPLGKRLRGTAQAIAGTSSKVIDYIPFLLNATRSNYFAHFVIICF